MILTVKNESPFQILSSSFSIGPSETGYELQVGADSSNFTTLFSVGANTPRMVTNVANGSYFRLKNNVGDVKVNWQRVCVTEGGEGGSGTELQPVADFPLNAVEGTVISYTGSSSASGVYQYDGNEWTEVGADIDLSAYWTSAQTQSAITVVEDHLFDVEQVTASALTELHDGLLEVSARTVDMSAYWTSAETKTYVDSAVTDTQNQLNEISGMMQSKELVISTAFNQLSDEIDELSGRSVDLSAYYTSAQTEEAISAATSGKADKANVLPNYGALKFPAWNADGIIGGEVSTVHASSNFYLNGTKREPIFSRLADAETRIDIYAPQSAGNAGDILVSAGANQAPVWTTDNKVSSTSVSTIWKGTQAEYDAITTKDPNTFYIIVNN